jgi:hypothetical protein
MDPMDRKHIVRRAFVAALALASATACSDATGVTTGTPVSVSFRVAGLGPAAAGPMMVSGPARVGGPLVISGDNGSLTIDDIYIIINEVELDPSDGTCDLVEVSGEDCPDFEAPPRFLNLPLDGEPIAAVTAVIRPGSYKQLDFEIEDLEDDEDDPAEAAAIATVRAQILDQFPDWPRKASMMVVGSFAPSTGGSVDFRTFVDAEIEIEMDLVPNLVIAEDGTASRELTVNVRPDIWFTRANNTVVPLHLFDYVQTQQLLEDVEVEIEDGFIEIEHD